MPARQEVTGDRVNSRASGPNAIADMTDASCRGTDLPGPARRATLLISGSRRVNVLNRRWLLTRPLPQTTSTLAVRP